MIGKNYFINFIEEMTKNPGYGGFTGGRVEVWIDTLPDAITADGLTVIEEIRFWTTKESEFRAFRERWDFKNISKWRLNRLRKKIARDFQDVSVVPDVFG